MSKKLFVGGLAWATTEDGLAEAFRAVGPVVEAKIVTDRETGRSRGFGFVTMENDGDAEKSVEELNSMQLDGRTIRVDVANDRGSSGGGGGSRDGGGGWAGGGGGNRW